MSNGLDEKTIIDKTEYTALIKEADDVLASLAERLNNVTVSVNRSSVDVIVAIKAVFGNKYIKPDGSSEITFDMFQHLAKSLKKVGENKVSEYV